MDDTQDVICPCEFSLLIVSALVHKYVQLILNRSVKIDVQTTTALRWSNNAFDNKVYVSLISRVALAVVFSYPSTAAILRL